jgi:hypothetical protein
VWVVDVNDEVVHAVATQGTRVVRRREVLAPRAFPALTLDMAAIVA